MADWNLNPNINLGDYAAVIYVKADAPDGGDGSKAKPYNSAVQAVLSITEDNTAVLLASGTYEEEAYNIPGSYSNREYCLFGTRVNKSYSVIGDYLNPPTIIPQGGGISSVYNNYIICLFDTANTKAINICFYDLILKSTSDYWVHLLSNITGKYNHNVMLNNIVFEVFYRINSSVGDWANTPVSSHNHILYLNGTRFNSTPMTLRINNSLINAPYSKIIFANGTDDVVINNTLFIVEAFYAYGTDQTKYNQCSFNLADLTGISGSNNIANILATSFDQSYRNTDEQLDTAQIGPYHGTYHWGERGTGPVDPAEPTDPEPTGQALLRVTMTDSSEREYNVSSQDLDKFIKWINRVDTNLPSHTFDKVITKSKEYLLFDKIISFEVKDLK